MTSFMRREIEEIPDAVRRCLAANARQFQALGVELDEADPALVATVARGSSDHAATFLKYAIEITRGVPVASLSPSSTTIYGTQLKLDRAAIIGISQSGESPDIVGTMQSAAAAPVRIAITNSPGSPLTRGASHAIDLMAGPEKSVAATKSFVASVVAGLAILAEWANDEGLKAALAEFPDVAGRALGCDWSELVTALDGHQSLYVIGRGPGLAIAAEAALKLKETCGIHAEAYSSAEVLHGPARIVEDRFPVLALVARDKAEDAVCEIAERLAGQGAEVFATSARAKSARQLASAEAAHPLTDALALIVTFYGFAEALSRHRGFDPDRPPHLNKVTRTV